MHAVSALIGGTSDVSIRYALQRCFPSLDGTNGMKWQFDNSVDGFEVGTYAVEITNKSARFREPSSSSSSSSSSPSSKRRKNKAHGKNATNGSDSSNSFAILKLPKQPSGRNAPSEKAGNPQSTADPGRVDGGPAATTTATATTERDGSKTSKTIGKDVHEPSKSSDGWGLPRFVAGEEDGIEERGGKDEEDAEERKEARRGRGGEETLTDIECEAYRKSLSLLHQSVVAVTQTLDGLNLNIGDRRNLRSDVADPRIVEDSATEPGELSSPRKDGGDPLSSSVSSTSSLLENKKLTRRADLGPDHRRIVPGSRPNPVPVAPLSPSYARTVDNSSTDFLRSLARYKELSSVGTRYGPVCCSMYAVDATEALLLTFSLTKMMGDNARRSKGERERVQRDLDETGGPSGAEVSSFSFSSRRPHVDGGRGRGSGSGRGRGRGTIPSRRDNADDSNETLEMHDVDADIAGAKSSYISCLLRERLKIHNWILNDFAAGRPWYFVLCADEAIMHRSENNIVGERHVSTSASAFEPEASNTETEAKEDEPICEDCESTCCGGGDDVPEKPSSSSSFPSSVFRSCFESFPSFRRSGTGKGDHRREQESDEDEDFRKGQRLASHCLTVAADLFRCLGISELCDAKCFWGKIKIFIPGKVSEDADSNPFVSVSSISSLKSEMLKDVYAFYTSQLVSPDRVIDEILVMGGKFKSSSSSLA